MDIRIAVADHPKEIEVNLGDLEKSAIEKLQKSVEDAISSQTVLWLMDRRGRRVAVPGARIACVEILTEATERKVGFGAAN